MTKTKVWLESYEKHSIDIVNVAVFPSTIVDIVTRHADFWAVEDGRLSG